MKVRWFRRGFLLRRQFDRIFLDIPDAMIRRPLGRSHWPPYSLRAFVGGPTGFDKTGNWFLEELRRLQLFGRGTRVLDIGCGCGRIAWALATDESLNELQICYAGMDIDLASIEWCRRHITPVNERFVFEHADCQNPSYNPQGTIAAGSYSFPHPASSFDLILLTSVFTHLLEDELRQYLAEVSRLLVAGGIAYASFFLYDAVADAGAGIDRHGIRFPVASEHHAVNREDYPTHAVAYDEGFVRSVAAGFGLSVLEPAYYGIQDVLLFTKIPNASLEPELMEGWHALEDNCWRWTQRVFAARLPRPAAERMTLRFRFILPQAVIDENGPLRLTAIAEDTRLPACEYANAGEHLYVTEFSVAPGKVRITIRFELNKAYGPSQSAERELGLQVVFKSCSGPLHRSLQPFLLT